MKADFLSPTGRLVQGDPMEAQTKNMQGQPLMTQSGQPTQRHFIAVAFKKDDPAFAPFYSIIDQTARGSWPSLNIAPPWDPACRFSWKVMDGDGIDDNGKQNGNKEGFAGHWVVKFSSSFAPRCFHAGHYAPHEQIQDPKAIQRGYFVRVAGTVEGNSNQQKPGVYVNLGMVELVLARPDLVITTGPDASSVFGNSAPALPAGLPPAPAGLPGMPGGAAVLPGFPSPALPGAVAAVPYSLPPTSSAAAPAGPATTFPSSPIAVLPNPGILAAPAGIPVAPPPPPAAGPRMTAKAGGATFEQFVGQGWSLDQMRAAGYVE